MINKTRDSVEKAKASKTHSFPYDAATPSLVPDDNVITRSMMDFILSEGRSRYSRVIGGNEVLYSPWWIVVIEPIDEAEIVAVGGREGQLGSTAAGIRTPYADSCHGGAMQLVICGTLLP